MKNLKQYVNREEQERSENDRKQKVIQKIYHFLAYFFQQILQNKSTNTQAFNISITRVD